MKKLLLLLPLLSLLGGCAGLGQFTGSAVGAYREATRGPDVVYVPQPRPYYRPYRRWW